MSSFTDYNPHAENSAIHKIQDQQLTTMLIKNHHVNHLSQLSQELADFNPDNNDQSLRPSGEAMGGVGGSKQPFKMADQMAEKRASGTQNQKKKKISNIQPNEMQMMLSCDGQLRNYALYSNSSQNNSITSANHQSRQI